MRDIKANIELKSEEVQFILTYYGRKKTEQNRALKLFAEVAVMERIQRIKLESM